MTTQTETQVQSATMKAVAQSGYGPPDILRIIEVERPVPNDEEVLVRVHAAAVNWADWAATTGVPFMIRLYAGLRRPKVAIRGSDVAGIVQAVGKNVSRFHPGQEVFGWCDGAFADYACANEDHFAPKPARLTFEEAAAVPMAGTVALQAVRDVGRVWPGDRILINGASGGIGTFAVQIAKAFQADVTGVCRSSNVELVRSLGADHVIDYTREDFTRGGHQYDFILDIPDKQSVRDRMRALTPSGTLAPCSGEGNRWIGPLHRIVWARVLSLFMSRQVNAFLALRNKADLLELTELIESGKVRPVIDRVYPLAEVPDAIAYVGMRHCRGKVVIRVSGNT